MIRALRRAWNRLLGSLFGRRRESDLAEELESHIQLLAEENIRRGVPPEEAHRRARLQFGSVESTKESYRDQRGLPVLDALVAGSPLCVSRDPQKSRFRRRRDPFARHRHRRQHRHLLAGQCRAAPAARLQGPAARVRGSRVDPHLAGRVHACQPGARPRMGQAVPVASSRSH